MGLYAFERQEVGEDLYYRYKYGVGNVIDNVYVRFNATLAGERKNRKTHLVALLGGLRL